VLKQSGRLGQVFFLGFSENRYVALEEVGVFLEANNVSLRGLFEVLCRVHDGHLIFSFGGVTVEFSRGFKPWFGQENVIELSIELQKDRMGNVETWDYEFRAEEIEVLTRNVQLKTLDSE